MDVMKSAKISTITCCVMPADTEMEAEVEPSLETEERLAAEEAAKAEAQRRHEQELATMAQVRSVPCFFLSRNLPQCQATHSMSRASHIAEDGLLAVIHPGSLGQLMCFASWATQTRMHHCCRNTS